MDFVMSLILSPLPYAPNALEPYISAETLSYHHGKHHATYVNKLNELVTTPITEADLPQIILDNPSGPIFNNAAQVWNHTFYWNCLSANAQKPTAALEKTLAKHFGSLDEFKKEFTEKCLSLFGSGWVWLSLTPDQKIVIEALPNAGTPISHNNKPLLTCDVWEHAYYIDTRNSRPNYLKNYWEIINWKFVETNLQS